MPFLINRTTGELQSVTMQGLRVMTISRDGLCLLAMRRHPGHQCVGKWAGKLADPRNPDDWTLEHVTQVHGVTDVRRDDEAHCVGLCYGTNVKPPSKVERAVMREYLRDLFPSCTDLLTG